MVRLKYLVRERDERFRARGGDRIPLSVTIHRGVVTRDESSTKQNLGDDLENYKTCEPGDVVLNRMRAFQGGVGVAEVPGLVSPDYTVLEPGQRLDPEFLETALRSPWFIGQMSGRIRGIGGTEQGNVRTPRINYADLGDLAIPCPARADQQRLIQDAKGTIRASTAATTLLDQRRSLLRQKLDSLITAAVTGQLDVTTARAVAS